MTTEQEKKYEKEFMEWLNDPNYTRNQLDKKTIADLWIGFRAACQSMQEKIKQLEAELEKEKNKTKKALKIIARARQSGRISGLVD